jgi:Recombination endonuclease VII
MKPTHLFTPKDVKEARLKLLEKQGGKDPITNETIPDKQSVLDHDHKTQYVRAVLHRQINVFVGKIENAFTRYISWWYNGTLPQLLRGVADYLDKEQPREYVHPKFINKLNSEFSKLRERDKNQILVMLGVDSEEVDNLKNGVQRKAKFVEQIKTGKFNYETVYNMIKTFQ